MREIPRRGSLCDQVVWAQQSLSVRDTALDPRFANDPLVSGPQRVRSYLGIPLFTRDGQPMGDTSRWKQADPIGIAREAIDAGCSRFIVLDIARVGIAAGLSTLPLCAEILRRWPYATIVTGGGIRGIDDLRRLDPAIVDGVLIASALHNGAITSAELASLTR